MTHMLLLLQQNFIAESVNHVNFMDCPLLVSQKSDLVTGHDIPPLDSVLYFDSFYGHISLELADGPVTRNWLQVLKIRRPRRPCFGLCESLKAGVSRHGCLIQVQTMQAE